MMISKWYLLRTGRSYSEEKSLSLFGGLSDQEEKPFPQIQQEMQKALDHGYQKICLPWNFIYHSKKDLLFSWILGKPQLFVLSVHKKSSDDFSSFLKTQTRFQFQLPKKLSSHLTLNHLIDEDPFFFKKFEKQFPNFVLTLLGYKKTNLRKATEQLKQSFPPSFKISNEARRSKLKALFKRQLSLLFRKKAPQIFMSFPCSHKKHPDLYTPEEIYSFLNEDFYPPPPFDTYNLSIPKDLKLEPSLKPQFEFPLKQVQTRQQQQVTSLKPQFEFPLKQVQTRQQQQVTSLKPQFEFPLKPLTRLKPNSTSQNTESIDLQERIKTRLAPNSTNQISAPIDKNETLKSQSKAFTKKRMKASVIIPVYGDSKELILTLKHLQEQDEDKTQFEVIVIDDGSPADISSQLKKLDFLKDMQFKFLNFPRVKSRTSPKDHRFRAGIARNLGARSAKGEYLFFLDADILTPPSYISSSLKELEKHPVIQHPRYHLIPSAPCQYQKIVKSRHCFVRAQPYWEDFYESSQNWNEISLPWKYISTNTLCLSLELFQQIGAFRKNYTCYGFEDTDLGYRLYQAGFSFYLHKLNTYHLYRDSEYRGQESLKQELLSLSALTFFHNTHSLLAYREFAHLIKKQLLKKS